MKYCNRCLYPENHPLNIILDDEGICSGCRVHEEKDALDWRERFARLKTITDGYRSRSGKSYDCIVPVSGARDSHFMVHVVKNVLGLRPLLAYYNSLYNTDLGTRNLAYLRIAFRCDMLGLNPSYDTAKAVTRASLVERGSMYWHVLAGQTVWPVRLAIQYRIPLIIWGAHQGLDQVGMFSHLDEVEMTRKYRKEHDLMGVEIEDLAASHPELNDHNIAIYDYPHDAELEQVGVRGIYLNNYLRWDSKAQHELMIRLYDYETAAQQRTFDTYNDVDSHHYSGLHDLIKFRKHGYGKVVDHACREIRLRRMTREQGLAFVEKYRDVAPKDVPLFLDWLGMSEDELWNHVDCFRDPRVWQKDPSGQWRLRHSVLTAPLDRRAIDNARLKPLETWKDFRLTASRKPHAVEDKYVTIGKGYVDGEGPHIPVASQEMPASSGLADVSGSV